MAEKDQPRSGGRRKAEDKDQPTPDAQTSESTPGVPAGDRPPPAVQVGQGEAGERAREQLTAHAHGDVVQSRASGDDVAATTGLGADDDRAAAQVGAAEAVQAAAAGNERVQEQADAENAAGYRGINPDPTPNYNYTSAGVAEGAPTPETDPDSFEDAQRALRPGGGRFAMTREAVEARQRARSRREASK